MTGSYKIGHLTDLSGPTSANFRPLYEGMKAYVDYVNANCGIHGKEIELVPADDRAEPVRGVEEYKRLVADPDLLAVTGLSISPVMLALFPEIDGGDTPVVIGGSNVPEAIEPVRPNVFTLGPVLTASLPVAGAYLQSEGVEDATFDVCAIDSPGGQAVLELGTRQLAELGYDVAEQLALPTAGTDFNAEVLRLRNSDAEYLSCVISEQQTIPLLEAIQANGVDRTILMGPASASDAIFERFSGLDYRAFRTFVSPVEDDIEAVAEMLEQARSVGVEGDVLELPFFTVGWVLGKVVLNAIEACGEDCTSIALRDALEQTRYDCEGQQLCAGVNYAPDDHYGFEGAKHYEWSDEEGRAVPTSEDWTTAAEQ